MALIKCVDCGKDISDKAKSCPNCGCPVEESVNKEVNEQNHYVADVGNVAKNNKSNKKKIIVIIVILCLLFICGIGFIFISNISLHSIKCYLFGCSEPVETFYCEYDQNIYDKNYNYLVVVNEYVNVRADASRNSEYITKVCSGNAYNVVELKEVDGVTWFKIKYDYSSYGWIISGYNGDTYADYFNLGKIIGSSDDSKSTTKPIVNKTTKKTSAKENTSRKTTKKTTTKVTTTKTTKVTTTQTTVRSLKIGSKTGVGEEYIYGKNRCTLDSLTVTPEVSKYTGSVKFNVKGKFTKTYNPSSTIGYCSVVVNFYDSTGIKIGSTTLSSSGLAVGESGLANSITYADAYIDDIVGNTITVKVSNRA